MIPPKMFTRIAFTFHRDQILNASVLALRSRHRHVEKVGRTAAVKFDDVHVAIARPAPFTRQAMFPSRPMLVQFMFRRFDFARIFLRNISHRRYLRMR